MTINQTGSSGTTALLDKEELRRTIAQVLDIDIQELTDDARFIADLGVDSLLSLEVLVVLEKTYDLRIGEHELRRITSVGTAYELLLGKLVSA